MEKEVPKNNGIRWTSKTIFVDIDTGEILTKHNAKTNYLIIKKTKNAEVNTIGTAGTIIWTNECRKSRQGNFGF